MTGVDPRVPRSTRRRFLRRAGLGASALALGGVVGAALTRTGGDHLVWQIDPWTCIRCGRCETECVLDLSAVKCVHAFPMCGYCKLCFGFFRTNPHALNTGAENQMCPTGAIIRTFVEDPYHEYTIDEELCTGCGLCVAGCATYGNSSLYLQVRHDRCVGCNECSIAAACPSGAFIRLPAQDPYVRKREGPEALQRRLRGEG